MRISQASACTHMTERAIRLYIQEGLLKPGQHNGILDLSESDILLLSKINRLRKADFSIPQIRQMLQDDSVHLAIQERAAEIQSRISHDQALFEALQPLAEADECSVDDLVAKIERQPLSALKPDFSRVDDTPGSEKEASAAWDAVNRAENQRARRRRLIPLYILGGLALLFVLFFLLDAYQLPADSLSLRQDMLFQQKLREILRYR